MSSMHYTCRCGKTLQIPEALAGKRIRCPHCQTSQTVPGESLDDLPIALDHPLPPKPVIQAPPATPATTAPAEAAAPAAGPADAGLDAALGDLAAAVSQVTAGNSSPAGSTAAAIRPTVVAARPVAARPKKAGTVKTGQGTLVAAMADDGPPKKKRDMLPLMIAGGAGLLLIVAIIAMVAVKKGDTKSEAPTNTAQRPTAVPPPREPVNYETSGDSGFFPGVPAGRTSEDARREKEERRRKNGNLPQ